MKFFPALFGAALLLAGCNVIPPPQADSTRTYVLTETLPSGQASGIPAAGRLRVGLKRVELGSYLDTSDMVVREGPNQIELKDYARWAEPLDAGIARILQDQLSAAPAIGRVYVQPFPFDAERDYDVRIVVLRCEGSIATGRRAAANFAASIEITTPGPESKVVARRIFVPPGEAWDGHDYRPHRSVAAIRSRAATTFSRLLKALMRTCPSPQRPKPAPGVQTTWARSSSRSKNSQESRPVLIQM
jgi:hypothetical protein